MKLNLFRGIEYAGYTKKRLEGNPDYALKCRVALDNYGEWFDDLPPTKRMRVLQIIALNEVCPAPAQQVIMVG